MQCHSRRDVFLQIESVPEYSPLAPLLCARRYGRDCQLNEGHELGRIPAEEILAARIDALVYREYLDASYTQPNTAKLVSSDSAEPPWNRRVPSALIWTRPGERLHIHVRNGDPNNCHSLHVHGLRYGIESDGAWPRGVASKDGRRSDEIRPGETWTYVFDVSDDMIGTWPFHDHVRHVDMNMNRGLIGGIIVRDLKAPRVDHEVPLFVHMMAEPTGHTRFESNTLSSGGTFAHVFADANEVVDYFCRIHGASMAGRVHVVAGTAGPDLGIAITDNQFTPADVTITAGTKVIWTNAGSNQHIVFAGGGGKATYCLNGRAFVGNTPTIEASPGHTIRWYLFNLDVGSAWHNFHPHASRWQIPAPPGGASDVHALSPVEAFVVDTVVPPALRLPCELERLQCCPPRDACLTELCADFLFHCHIEEHMMAGLAGVIRVRQKIWITAAALKQSELVLPLGCCGEECAWVDLKRCAEHGHHPSDSTGQEHGHAAHGAQRATRALGAAPFVPAAHVVHMPANELVHRGVPTHILTIEEHAHLFDPAHRHELVPLTVPAQELVDPAAAAQLGYWELLPCELPVLAVHAALMHTGKILFFAGSGNDELYKTGFRSAIYDYRDGTMTMPVTPTDVFCAGQAFLPDGRVLVAGGTDRYDPFVGLQSALLFDPQSEQWTFVQAMKWGRWYPTLVGLGDGRVLATSGFNDPENELYAGASGWTPVSPNMAWPLYPHLHLLHDGRLFHSGMRLGGTGMLPGFLDPLTGAYNSLPPGAIPASFNLGARDQGATVLLPPAQEQRIMLMGGGSPSINDVHIIDTDAASPQFVAAPPMLRNRVHVNAVILPDRTVVATGGSGIAEDALTASTEAEIYDPATNTWTTGARARVPRLYHSVAVLLPDARVLTAGSNPSRRNDEMRLEIYHPPYLFRGARPCIERAPSELALGASFSVHIANSPDIKWLSLVRPMATTHSYDSEQRLVDLPFRRTGVCQLNAELPGNPNLVPPGWYMLFAVNHRGVPSQAHWIHVSAPARAPRPPVVKGDIFIGTANRIVRVDAKSGATELVSEGGELGNVEGLEFDAHGHLLIANDAGEVLHVVPASGAQHVVHRSERMYQDVVALANGDFAAVNLSSASPSGLFIIDHATGEASQLNTGQHFGDGPSGLVIGRDGSFYVTELGRRAVIQVDARTGAEREVSRGGHFVSPSGIALAADGHLLVCDHGADKVIRVDPESGHQQLVAAGGLLSAPVDIAVEPSGQLLVVDLLGDRLLRIDPGTAKQAVLAQSGLLTGIRSVAVFGMNSAA